MFKRIVVPVDGSELSLKATASAVGLAKEVGAEVIVMHASAPYIMPYGAEYAAAIDSSITDTLRKNSDAAVKDLVEEAAKVAANAGVKYQTVIEEAGRPEIAIEKVVKDKDADLVVIATHGRGAVGRFVMGSVTTRLLSISPVPVLVYRDGTAS